MLGFGLASATMTVAKDWFARHWRGAATVSLALFGPLAVGANLYVQHLGFNAIFLVSDPAQKWKLLQIFLAELTPFLAGAFFLGCVFLRSNRTFGRVYFADLAGAGLCGLVVLLAMYVFTPANLIAAPLALVVRGLSGLGVRPRRTGHARSICRRRRARVRRPFRRAADVWPEDAGRQRLQGRRLRAQIPGREKSLRERFPVRLSRGLLELLSAFCARPVRQRRLHPADDAGQRLSRPLYRRRRSDRHHARSDRQGDGVLPLPADGLPLCHQVGAEDFHRPVRRRHLDRGRAALRREGRDGRRGQSRRARGVSRRRHPQLHRRHPVQGPRHWLRGPPFPGANRRALRRHRPLPCGFGRPLQPRRLRHRGEVLLYEGGDGDLHARAGSRRRAVGHALE